MKLLTANRLDDGRVIYLGADGVPTPRLAEAASLDEAAAAES